VSVEDDFTAFVSARYPALVRYGVSLVADVGRSEDLVQQSLVKTLRAWSRIADDAPEAYTKRVMVRAAWRSTRRWRTEVPTDQVPERPSTDPAVGIDLGDMVRRALATLPVGQRVVLTLRYLDGMSEAETAAQLKCSVGTVKSRGSRGLAALRELGLLEEPRPSSTERTGAA
jgi:RNA polymerase sigma-70 factor (sigma-E family)